MGQESCEYRGEQGIGPLSLSGAQGPERATETREEPTLPWKGDVQTVLEGGLARIPGLVWGRGGPHH